MDPVKALKAARKLIANPKRWSVGSAGKDAMNYTCDPSNPRAVSWCAAGALEKVSKQDWFLTTEILQGVLPPFHYVSAQVPGYDLCRPMTIVFYNDRVATHEEVLQAFDVAISQFEE